MGNTVGFRTGELREMGRKTGLKVEVSNHSIGVGIFVWNFRLCGAGWQLPLGVRRVMQTEILDSLPDGHPDAAASRRDLRRLNFLMGTHRWLRRRVSRLVRSGSVRSVLELGAGDGSLALGFCHRDRSRMLWTGIDRIGAPLGWPVSWEWICADVLDESCTWPQADVGVVNLMLHHFEGEELRLVLRRLCNCCAKIFLCEPVRRRLHIVQLSVLRGWFLHPVTWHDARVSVLAGFVPGELKVFFPDGWQLRECCSLRGFLAAEANPGLVRP